MTKRSKIAVLSALAALGCGFVVLVWSVAADLGVRNAERIAADRARFYAATLSAALERYEHLPFVLARDPVLIAAAQSGDVDALNRRLETFAEQAGVDALYLMTPTGLTISASNWRDPGGGFVGNSYHFRPYFQTAAQGRRGSFFAVGATTGEPGWFLAEPARALNGDLVGVVAAKVDLRPLEDAWRDGGERVFVADEAGVLALSSERDWLYRTLKPLSAERRAALEKVRQYGDEALTALDETPIDRIGREPIQSIAGTAYIRGDAPASRGGMRVIYLSDYAAAVAGAYRAASIAAAVLLALAALGVAMRSQRIRAALTRSQRRAAELSALNRALEDEVIQRRAAEQRLEAAQAELQTRSKLEALGQLSAAVNHELSQPLAAMKTYLVAQRRQNGASKERPSLSFDLEALVDRMIAITKQMKALSRRTAEQTEETDAATAIHAALKTMGPLLSDADIAVELELPNSSALVRIDQLRLEQVLVNVIGNAIDAMRESSDKRLRICLAIASCDERVSAEIDIQDSGPGLPTDAPDRIFEPFFSTKASGEGMGLGLALSARLIEEAKGQISAANAESGGAIFHIRLPAREAAPIDAASNDDAKDAECATTP